MQVFRFLLFMMFIFCFHACLKDKKLDNPDPVVTTDHQKIEEMEVGVKAPPISCRVAEQAGNEELISFLKSLNYDCKTEVLEEQMVFESGNPGETPEKTVSFGLQEVQIIRARSKQAIKSKTGTFYPSFTIRRFCLEMEESLHAKYERRIREIIQADDMINGKKYDYLIRSGHNYLYVSTVTKMYEPIILQIKKELVSLMQKESIAEEYVDKTNE